MSTNDKKKTTNSNSNSKNKKGAAGKKFGQSSQKVFMDLSDLKKVLPQQEEEKKEKP